MLSLNGGTKIAKINNDPKKLIYIKEDEKDKKAEVQTTDEKKYQIYKDYITRDKKLRKSDIEILLSGYRHKNIIPDRLQRKYEDGIQFIEDSLKHYLDYPKSIELTPIMPEWYTMFVSGLTGSGKSHYIANLLKNNKPKFIFIMSPVHDDPAFKSLKPTPIHIDILSYEQEFDKQFEIEDIPPDSVVILDDIDTDNKMAKIYQEIKVQLLERGRHLKVSTIAVSHNPLGGNVKHAKAQLLESHYYVIFPKANRAHAEKLLKSYVLGNNKEKIDEIMNIDSRGVLIKKTYPAYYIGEHTIGTI
jgi:hypothetical protein